jgi:hypothetical protein
MQKKSLETGISLHRAPPGEPGSGLVYRDFERWRALEMENLSLLELYEENLEGGLLY